MKRNLGPIYWTAADLLERADDVAEKWRGLFLLGAKTEADWLARTMDANEAEAQRIARGLAADALERAAKDLRE
jgi:hypothetical protein